MVTMLDVAKTAGVSVSTVSHVVNGTRFVGEGTRSRVEAVIADLGYKQDALARALRRSQTDSIGVVVSDGSQPAFAGMIHGVEQAASRMGLTLLLASSAESAQTELQVVQALLERRVDGLILARTAASTDEVIRLVQTTGTPLVLMDRLGATNVDQVGVDSTGPVAEVIRHLAEGRHEELLFVGGDLRVPTLRERYEGFVVGVRSAGLDPSRQHEITGTATPDETRDAVTRVLRAPNRPTAVFASSTVLAAAALYAAQGLGLAIPDDLAFAAYDGFAYSDLFAPQITTIRQPATQVGEQAMELLAEHLDRARPSRPARTVRLQPLIEYRESTRSRR